MEQDNLLREAQKVRAIIQQKGVSVYDSPTNVESDDFFTVVQLEALLKKQLIGRTDLAGLAVRTRSRIAKTLVCEALGYQAPRSFKREAYSAAGKTWFGWWLVEHYFSYHVDCPDGCDSGEPARGRKDPPYFQMSYGSFDHIPDLVDPFVESLLPA